MTHKGTERLETERLILRRFDVSDAENMFLNWASNKKVTEFLTWNPHASADDTKQLLTEWVNAYNEPNYYQWAIVLKDSDQPIGSISAVNIKENIGEVEIGYCIGEKWWHRGYTSEAFKRIIEFLFQEVGVKRIFAVHAIENPNSGKVMQKCGLSYEGRLRRAGITGSGRICDMAIYSILSES